MDIHIPFVLDSIIQKLLMPKDGMPFEVLLVLGFIRTQTTMKSGFLIALKLDVIIEVSFVLVTLPTSEAGVSSVTGEEI